MITELSSVLDVRRKMPSEHHARLFLERLVWPDGRFCAHCGSTRTAKLAGGATRPWLYRCREVACRGKFTVTTKTPLHATKLDLRVWIAAIFDVLTSSKGISSVVMARTIGVNQKTAWRMGHAIRELMQDQGGDWLPPTVEVEVDEAYVGGAPKSLARVPAKRGRSTAKPSPSSLGPTALR